MSAIGRNQPCPCGSGKKYKRCCALRSNVTPWRMRIVIGLVALSLLGGLVVILRSFGDLEPGAPSGRVWSAEHGHWH